MKKILSLSFISLLIVEFFMSSCKNENSKGLGQVEFLLHTSLLKNSLRPINDSSASADLAWVVYTFEDASGNVIKTSEKIELYDFTEYGHYNSKPISLTKGSYKLTRFLLLDWRNKVVYASPVAGSSKASLVQNPLPLSFNVQPEELTQLTPEVLSTYDSNPEDFGYVTFGFAVANTFDFLIGVFIYNDSVKNYELTSASINIKSDATTNIYYGPLNGKQNDTSGIVSDYDSIGVTNRITLPERYKNYTIIISKPGYVTYSQTFTKEELKLYLRSVDKGPLVVILEKSTLIDGLVAYYKFNGDVLDYSGNNNNGTNYGRGYYTTGRLSEPNATIDLNGSSDYVVAKSSPSLNPDKITVCAWYYAISFYGNGANSLVTKRSNTTGTLEYQYNLCLTSDLYSVDHFSQFVFNITTDQGEYPVSTTGTGDFSYIFYQYQLYQWNFIVGTYDGDSVKLFVNGELKAWRSASGNLLQSTKDVYMGNTEGLTRPDYDYTAGRIDEIRIYNRALTQEEIVSLYQQ